MQQRFKAKLTSRGPGGAWTFLPIPFDVEKAFGSKARVSVAGTMNGCAFQNSLLPQGDGTHQMAVSKDLQAARPLQRPSSPCPIRIARSMRTGWPERRSRRRALHVRKNPSRW